MSEAQKQGTYMTNKKIVFVPFEIKDCPEHGEECGGLIEPRFDLPVFRNEKEILAWIINPDNAPKQYGPNGIVQMQWQRVTEEEAVSLGFKLPQEILH